MQRSCQEVSYIDFAKRALIEILCRDLARGTLLEILYRDLVKRAEVLLGDHLQINWAEILPWDPLRRSSVEISYRHLVQIALHRDLAQQILQRTCPGDRAHDLLQRSSQRELAESYLVSFLFATRVALVLLACSHWCFLVVSAFRFRILTTRCFGVSCRDNQFFIREEWPFLDQGSLINNQVMKYSYDMMRAEVGWASASSPHFYSSRS